MAMMRRKRLPDGTLGMPEKIGSSLTDAEKIIVLENALLESQMALAEMSMLTAMQAEENLNTQAAIAELSMMLATP